MVAGSLQGREWAGTNRRERRVRDGDLSCSRRRACRITPRYKACRSAPLSTARLMSQLDRVPRAESIALIETPSELATDPAAFASVVNAFAPGR